MRDDLLLALEDIARTPAEDHEQELQDWWRQQDQDDEYISQQIEER